RRSRARVGPVSPERRPIPHPVVADASTSPTRGRENRPLPNRPREGYLPPMRQSFEETTGPSFGAKHLPRVRAKMAEQGLDGLLVPHEDEHQNEYLPAANDRLAWLTGFTGSAGAGAVLKDRAAVFADGRYTVQVRAQVDAAQFEILSLENNGVAAWLESAPKGATIGYDPRLHSPDALASLKRAANKAGAVLKPVEANPIDLAW